MGLFSGKTKIYVASSAYNLAGDVNTRPNYMKTTVIGAMLQGQFAMADVISNSYMGGPGIRMRLFSSWSKNHYDDEIGLAAGSLGVVAAIDPSIVASQITPPSGETTYVQAARIDFADFQEWCDQYIYENYPERVNEAFEIDIDEDTNLITMTSTEGGSTITFTPVNFVQGALYLYADYTFYKEPSTEPPVVGPLYTYDNESELPSTFLWTKTSDVTTPESTALNQHAVAVATYSDGRPSETTTTDTPSTYTWSSYVKVYKRGFTVPIDPTTIVVDNRVMTHKKIGSVVSDTTSNTVVEDIGGGVTKTTVTTTTTESVEIQYTSQSVTNNTTMTAAGKPHLLIYKQGDGNAVLDALFDTDATDERFYPFIPIRNNKAWVETDPDIWPLCNRAFKKATGGKLSKVVTELKKNDKIGDIQYIYGTFGCSLNTPEDTAKEYIYRFFNKAAAAFPPDPLYPTLDAVIAGFEAGNAAADAYVEWWNLHGEEGEDVTEPPPPLPVFPTIPSRTFRVSSDKGYKYDMSISWNYVFETSHSGEAWTGAKQGQLRSRYAGNVTLTRKNIRTDPDTNKLVVSTTNVSMQELEMLWQTSATTYTKLRVLGLSHKNRVYKNKSVDTDVAEAMGDAEESGFIIPLNTSIYRSMSLTRSTQMSTACTYLILNSYKKVKEKWYQTGAFKIAVIVVAVVISIYTMGAGGAGILGAYGSVGAALGFAGLAAVIVGAVANAVAAMVLISIIQKVSVGLFGDKIGFIVAAVASIVAMNVGGALATGSTMSTMMGNMMSAQNIMQLTSAVGNGISQYINASTVDTIKEAERVMQQYNRDSNEIQAKYEEMFGTAGQGVIDPMSFVSIESLDTFLSRTLLTGSDIAGMSMDMIGGLTDMTLSLDQNT
ncbi:MAG: hypothetical protein [Caudoviricetes sp.]|nr:MAG: hypothetical protein [Caudoviricetes sp.]